MKKIVVICFALGVLNLQAGMSKLEALSMLETGNNDFAVGKAGEVSRYQILPRVWRHYTKSVAYTKTPIAGQIAARHLAELESAFLAQVGREPTDFDRYVLWNAGLGYYARRGFNSARVHASIRERANRFVNLRQRAPEPNLPLLAMGN